MTEAAAEFSALGGPLDEAESAQIDAYLAGLGLRCPVHSVSSWQEASEVSNRPAPAWWAAEEAERRPSPSGSLSTRRCTASYAAYQARLARAACAGEQHPFLRKYALYCGGR